MGDIQRNTGLVPIEKDPQLAKKHREIQINEKLSLIKVLKGRLDDLVNVEAKKLELQIDVLEKEIALLQDKNTIEV